MIALAAIALAALALTLLLWESLTAPTGWEDSEGFHLGAPDEWEPDE